MKYTAVRGYQISDLRKVSEPLKIMLSSRKKPLFRAGLRQLVSRALDKGWIKEEYHSETDRAYRNISADDIEHGLELKSWIIEKTEFAKEAGLFKYTIRTVDIEGDELHLVILPYPATGTVKIITKY